MRYKDFPKHDLRRCLAVLFTLDMLGPRATLHYAAQALECTRAEVSRAIVLAQQQFAADIEKTGAVYHIRSWGLIDRARAVEVLGVAGEPDGFWKLLQTGRPTWTRENEASLVESLFNAVQRRRTPRSDREADVYRLTAQLLKTRYRTAAEFLDSAARQFYFKSDVAPRPFPQVVSDGLVSEVPRLRNLLEKRMEGVRSW